MRTIALMSLAAAPGAIAGYMVLMGYLIARIRPVPITFMPVTNVVDLAARSEGIDDQPQAVAV